MITRRLVIGASALGFTSLAGLGAAWAWKSGRLALGPVDLPEAALPPVSGLLRDGSPVPGVNTVMRDEKPLLLNFWASWCPYCRSEHAILMELARDPRFTLIGIVMDDTDDKVTRYLTEHGNPFAQVSIDKSRVIIRAMRQRGIPSTLLVPPGQSRVAAKHIGPLTPMVFAEQFLPNLGSQSARAV